MPVFIPTQGVYYYSDGSVYDGVWVAGKMQGKGSFLYPNGNKYDGDFFVSSYGLLLALFSCAFVAFACCTQFSL